MKNVFLLLSLASTLLGASSKLANDLRLLDPLSSADVIVVWKNVPGDAEDQKVSSRGGKMHTHFKSIKAGKYTLPAFALEDLANDPDVLYVAPDRLLTAKLDNSAAAINASIAWNAGYNGAGIGVALLDSGINDDPNLTSNGASRVVYRQDFSTVTGGGTVSAQGGLVGGLVTGVVGLVGGLLGGLVNTVNSLTTVPAADQYGHGQHIAGIIAANGSTSKCSTCTREFLGIAPAANLIDLRVLDKDGNGSDSAVIQAIDRAIALKDVYNIRVMNLSLGRPVTESYTQDPLCQAVEAAWQAGIVVVVSAGNNGRDNTYGEQGYGTITAPGNDPYVITVGAMKTMGTYTRTDDLIASYSSKGPTPVDHLIKPDIVAPGNLVVSLLAQGSTLQAAYPGNAVPLSYYEATSSTRTSNQYFILSGTSIAAGVVSGAVADLLQANPNLTPDQVKALLMKTTYKTFPDSSTVTDSTGTYTDYYDVFTVGAGYIDLGAALSSVNSVPSGSALSPAAVNLGNGVVSLVYANDVSGAQSIWATQSMWGAQSIWGARSLWGASTVNSNQCIWGAQSVWGASNTDGEQSIWGARSMWGASSSSAQSAASGQNVAITGDR